jgi:hypothetical protein
MDLTSILTKRYENETTLRSGQNKPNQTRNPQLATRNPQLVTRNSQPATRLTPDPILIRIDYAIIALPYKAARYTILYHAQNTTLSPLIAAPNRPPL